MSLNFDGTLVILRGCFSSHLFIEECASISAFSRGPVMTFPGISTLLGYMATDHCSRSIRTRTVYRMPRYSTGPVWTEIRSGAMSMVASLIGRWSQALSDYPPLQCRCRSRARASLRNRHQGPSTMGFEDEAEESIRRPCYYKNDRSKRPNELTSSIVPRGTSFHHWGGSSSFLLSH